MSTELKVPALGESINEVSILQWLKQEGDSVDKDEPIVEVESEKATVEVPSPIAGRLAKISCAQGDVVKVGDVIANIDENGAAKAEKKTDDKKKSDQAVEAESKSKSEDKAKDKDDASKKQPAKSESKKQDTQAKKPQGEPTYAPGIESSEAYEPDERGEEVVPMSFMRQTIARRLVQAQQTAAMLTTFNEVDMTAIMELRKRYNPIFQQRHGIKLGFMSFFAKAAIDALKQVPAINARIDDRNIVYRNYYDISIAVSTDKGLVVPVVRDADRLSFAEIELLIADLAQRASAGKLEPHDLEGGTFTITNGGIFGSLLSTPIINPPQSGVLGMHTIQQRPVAIDGKVEIRPMMYLALTYDHRMVDGREAVGFLKRIKETIEEPARIMMEV